MITALFVETNGVYFNDPRIDPWDVQRDAKKYRGKNKVIAHPPCQRWGRYWGGGPMHHGKSTQLIKGDDDGCFAFALWAVRTYGGVIEHPEASHAWSWFGLNKPRFGGGWIVADSFGGQTCCISQGHYGHKGQKMTWLYGVNIKAPELRWGKCPGKQLMEDGFHSKEERARLVKTGICHRMSAKQRQATPKKFKELLIELVSE